MASVSSVSSDTFRGSRSQESESEQYRKRSEPCRIGSPDSITAIAGALGVELVVAVHGAGRDLVELRHEIREPVIKNERNP